MMMVLQCPLLNFAFAPWKPSKARHWLSLPLVCFCSLLDDTLLEFTSKVKSDPLVPQECPRGARMVPHDDGPSMSFIEFCLSSLEVQKSKALVVVATALLL